MLICSYLVLLVVLRSVAAAAEGRAHEPALGRRGLRRARRGLPVRLARRHLGFNSLGYVNALTPPLLLAIVFGLSMDYEVFLLSRINERYIATGDNRPRRRRGPAD